jgi:HK97 family phage portal protein
MGLKESIITSLGGVPANNKSAKPTSTNSELPVTRDRETFLGASRLDASAAKLVDNTSLTREQQYTGIIYRAFTTIANRTAQVLINNLVLKDGNGEVIDDKTKHPYLLAIDESSSFTNFEFYYALATYLQLTGFAPVLAVRNYREGANGLITSVGDIKEFKLIRPYDLELQLSDEDDSLLGYKETIQMHNGQTKSRVLGVPQILPIKTFNPFDNLVGFAAATAANDYQYTSIEASKYTRRSMRNNISTSGILTVNKMLDSGQRENFKAELKHRYASDAADGSPIVAFGSDALSWQDLRQDMDKMALEKIHDMNTEDLLTVLGVSKTVMGIEQSGVTRETARVQQDLFLTNIVMPLAQSIVDEMNQDYRNYYNAKWRNNKMVIEIDSPVSKDYEAEKIEYETLSVKMDTAKKMYQMGATIESISDALELPEELSFENEPNFGSGNQDGSQAVSDGEGEDAAGNPVDQLPETTPPAEETQQNGKKKEDKQGKKKHVHNHVDIDEIEYVSRTEDVTAKNALTMEQVVEIKKLREDMANTIAATEMKYADDYANAIGKEVEQNEYIDDEQRAQYEEEIRNALREYYAAVVPILAQAVADYRKKQFGYTTQFEMDEAILKMIAKRVAMSSAGHLDTVENSLTILLKQGLDNGWSRDKMVREVKKKFTDEISKSRAKTLAVTETNNAFNKSQFWADEQFIAQNGLEERAYKQWVTYSANPCPHCLALAGMQPVAFNDAFIEVGQSFGAEFEKKDGTKVVRYITPKEEWGPVEDGNAHPNCNCKYRLVLKFN